MNQRNQIITFGKYKGKTIDEIHCLNPEYLLWADENIETFNLNDYFYYKCTELVHQIECDRIMDVSWAELKGY